MKTRFDKRKPERRTPANCRQEAAPKGIPQFWSINNRLISNAYRRTPRCEHNPFTFGVTRFFSIRSAVAGLGTVTKFVVKRCAEDAAEKSITRVSVLTKKKFECVCSDRIPTEMSPCLYFAKIGMCQAANE